MRTLIRNGYLMTLDDQDRILDRADILVQEGVIQAIEAGLDPVQLQPDEVIEAEGYLVAPGLFNAEFYSQQALERGLFENQPAETRAKPAAALPKDHLRLAALLSCTEMLKSGVTSAQDHLVTPASSALEAVEEIMQAYASSGMRAVLSLEILPSQLNALEPHSSSSTKEIIRIYDDVLARWHNSQGGRLRISLAPQESLLDQPDFVSWLSEVSLNQKIATHYHFNQTKSQVIMAKKRYQGATSIAHADHLGLLTPTASIAHAVWVTPEEIELLSRRKTSVIHTPLSDLSQGSGVMPLHRFLAAEVNVGLGTGLGVGDQSLFSAMKMAAAIHRVVQPYYDQWPKESQVLEMATQGSAKACGVGDQVGKIAVGFQADLVLYDLASVSFSPLNVVKSQFICLEDGRSTRIVMVAGKVLVRNGQPVNLDESLLLAELRSLLPQSSRAFSPASLSSEDLSSACIQRYLQDSEEPLEINRWANTPALPSQLHHAPKKGRQ